MSAIIKVENVSKVYRLGSLGSGSLNQDINSWWARIRGKEDPLMKIGQENKLDDNRKKGTVLALNDISFEVEQGAVLGIIGKNGAGKSTLLKILSKVTAPTKGNIKTKGRIASLLEVGTGFHPELTGRENIFLNGAILGMTKAEVRRKFDEIVDFSGVGRYIDTPVKRYSSGMYVRLAFAVAAHLEPEILVVDEVLAVGDLEFQKKCLGKMDAIAKGGRTVLFVSHNMNAVQTLCSRSVLLKNGQIAKIGETLDIINYYISNENNKRSKVEWPAVNAPGDEVAKLYAAKFINKNNEPINFADISETFGIAFTYEIIAPFKLPIPSISIHTNKGELLFWTSPANNESLMNKGIHHACVWIPENFFNIGTYVIAISLSSFFPQVVHFYEKDILVIDMIEDENKRESDYRGEAPGIIRPKLNWDI